MHRGLLRLNKKILEAEHGPVGEGGHRGHRPQSGKQGHRECSRNTTMMLVQTEWSSKIACQVEKGTLRAQEAR